MADHSQKTEQPTQKRLEEARRQGQFPVSRELVTAFQFTLFLWLVAGRAPEWMDALGRLMRHLIEAAFSTAASRGEMIVMARGATEPLVVALGRTGLLVVAATLAVHLLSTGWGVSTERLAPDFKRLNPGPRLARMASQNLAQLGQAALALPLFALVAYQVASGHLDQFLRLWSVGLESGVAWLGDVLSGTLWQGAGLLIVLGLLDYWRQRRRWAAELRMSKQEIRDEMKEAEGNPQMKMRIRRLMRERSRRRMMKDVETASAVIVNPTHYAVALRYVPGETPAPKVVAKGKNYLALRIRERARQHQVPIVENPPLAQALYRSARVGQEIPAELFRAVAEVLAYIYRMMNRIPGRAS